MRTSNLLILLAIFAAAGFVFGGCGGKSEIASEMTGTWKSAKSGASIQINLSGERKSIEIGDRTVPVKVKNIDAGSYTVKLEATPGGGGPTEWSLLQVWNDSGSDFTIRFDHDGQREILTRG